MCSQTKRREALCAGNIHPDTLHLQLRGKISYLDIITEYFLSKPTGFYIADTCTSINRSHAASHLTFLTQLNHLKMFVADES